MQTPRAAASRSVSRIASGVPAWAPQQMLADVTSSSKARSFAKPSPRSAFRSIDRGSAGSRWVRAAHDVWPRILAAEIGWNRIRSPAWIGK